MLFRKSVAFLRYPSLRKFACELTIDQDLTFDRMVDAGRYDKVDPCFVEGNYPLIYGGKRTVKLRLLPLSANMMPSQVPPLLRQHGVIHAGAREICALGAAHPALQRRCTILALGQEWVNPKLTWYDKRLGGGNFRSPTLTTEGGKRILTLDNHLEGVNGFLKGICLLVMSQ